MRTLLAFVVVAAIPVGAQQVASKIDAGLYGDAKFVPRGVTTPITVYGRNLVVQSVSVQPADGIKVTKIEELPPNPGDLGAVKPRNWAVFLEVAADAAPGDRTVVVHTASGQAEAGKMRIPDRAVLLTGLKVVTATLPVGGASPRARVEFTADDPSGEIPKTKQATIRIDLDCGLNDYSFYPDKSVITPLGGRRVMVSVDSGPPSTVMAAAGYEPTSCRLKVKLLDATRQQYSNELSEEIKGK